MLSPFDLSETAWYVKHHFRVAGFPCALFSQGFIRVVYGPIKGETASATMSAAMACSLEPLGASKSSLRQTSCASSGIWKAHVGDAPFPLAGLVCILLRPAVSPLSPGKRSPDNLVSDRESRGQTWDQVGPDGASEDETGAEGLCPRARSAASVPLSPQPRRWRMPSPRHCNAPVSRRSTGSGGASSLP